MSRYQEPKQPGYVCPQTGRVAVLVSTFAASELNGDASAYLFNQDAEDMHLEPWRMIEGVDAQLNGETFEIWFSDGGFKTVGPRMTIFVSSKDAGRLAECI